MTSACAPRISPWRETCIFFSHVLSKILYFNSTLLRAHSCPYLYNEPFYRLMIMPSEPSLLSEMQARLEHLRSMPETAPRRRERLSLERAIAEASRNPQREYIGGEPPPGRRKASFHVNEPEEETPLRRIEHAGGRRRIILRRRADDSSESETQTAAEKRAREHLLRNIRATIGTTHRGMS